MKYLPALLFATTSGVLAHPVAPVRFRVVEANTSVCEWSGERSFTCRQIVAPVTLDLLFAEAAGRRVEVAVDGRVLLEVDRPGMAVLPAAELPPGAHRVTLALSDGGVSSWSRTFRMDVAAPLSSELLPPPVVSFATPRRGEPLAGPQEIRVWAHNPRSHAAIERVDVLVDGRPLATAGAGPFTAAWDTRAWGAGRHLLTARAVGQGGKVGIAEMEVEVLAVADLLPDVRSLHVPAGATRTLAIDVPPQAARAELRGQLQRLAAGQGRVRGVLRDADGHPHALFALEALARPIPITVDLIPYLGQRVTLELSSEGGAELHLVDVHAEALR